MANDRCPSCGALYALVGRRHLCRPRSPHAAIIPRSTVATAAPAPAAVDKPPVPKRERRYDKDRRRDYMREYMRKRRAAARD